MLTLVLYTLAGVALALPLTLLPGMHVYNLMALLVVLAGTAGGLLPAEPSAVQALAAAMVTAYAIGGIVPAVYLAAPDDASLFTVRPGQRLLLDGRGFEAVHRYAIGAGLALLVLLPVLLILPAWPVASLHALLRPHLHWILWCLILLMLMTEWPRTHIGRPPGWRWFWVANRSCLVGTVTFLLSGLLGCLVMFGHPLPPERAFQGLMPVFVGLFTIPQLLLNMVNRVTVPPQRLEAGPVDRQAAGHGLLAGSLGGLFAALLPGVTGGVGGWLAGHVTALRNDQGFMVSQGASRTLYYTGGVLLLALPPLHLARGGAAIMTRTLVEPDPLRGLYATAAAVALAGAVSLLLLRPASRLVTCALARCGQVRIAAGTLALCMLLTWGLTGPAGVAILVVATGIGLIPVLHESRRLNCLGAILLPLAILLSGLDRVVAAALGLL